MNKENMKMEILDLNNEEDTKTTDEMEPKKPEEKTSPVKEILSWVLTIAFAIVAAILIKNYVIINANIPSGSMENTCLLYTSPSPRDCS